MLDAFLLEKMFFRSAQTQTTAKILRVGVAMVNQLIE